jgi:hypothetical protein
VFGHDGLGSSMTSPAVLSRPELDTLVAALIADGYRVIGPTVQDNAIVLAELTSGAQLPAGWSVDSAPGQYRLRRRNDAAILGTVGVVLRAGLQPVRSRGNSFCIHRANRSGRWTAMITAPPPQGRSSRWRS